MSKYVVILFFIISISYISLIYKQKMCIASIYWISIFNVFFLIPNLSQRDYFDYGYVLTNKEFDKVNLMYMFVLLVFIIANFITLNIKNTNPKNEDHEKAYKILSYKNVSRLNLIYTLLAFIILLKIGPGILHMGSSQITRSIGNGLAFIIPTVVFGLNLSSVLKLIYSKGNKQITESLIGVIFSIGFGLIIGFARRQIIFPIVIGMVFYLIKSNKKPKLYLLIIGICLGIFVIMPSMVSIRTHGIKEGVKNYSEVITGDYETFANYIQMSTDVSWSYSLSAIVITEDISIDPVTILKPITLVVPRFLWEQKPLPMSLQIVRQLGLSSDSEMSIPPGIVGESYIYFNYIGIVLVGLIWGIATAVIDKSLILKSDKNGNLYDFKNIVLITIAVQIITGAIRGDTATTLTETEIVVLPFIILMYICKFKYIIK